MPDFRLEYLAPWKPEELLVAPLSPAVATALCHPSSPMNTPTLRARSAQGAAKGLLEAEQRMCVCMQQRGHTLKQRQLSDSVG